MGEPVKIRCDAGSEAREAVLIVEEATTDRQVFKSNLVPLSNEPVTVENLPVGTYRTALQIKEKRVLSDVFLVSR
jgi:hypothetical protein